MIDNTDDYLRINEIKNWLYCPRIPFYTLCMQLDRETALSKSGLDAERETKKRMKRRKHALHAVHDGIRYFDVELVHHEIRLIGRIDEMVQTDDGVYLIDYKDTDQDYGYWRVQMLAYQLCAQTMGLNVLRCYVYTIPNQTYHQLRLTEAHHTKLNTCVSKLDDIIVNQVCPPATENYQKCFTCQYARWCNDVT